MLDKAAALWYNIMGSIFFFFFFCDDLLLFRLFYTIRIAAVLSENYTECGVEIDFYSLYISYRTGRRNHKMLLLRPRSAFPCCCLQKIYIVYSYRRKNCIVYRKSGSRRIIIPDGSKMSRLEMRDPSTIRRKRGSDGKREIKKDPVWV